MMFDKAKCDYKTTRDREQVLDDAYDFASWFYYQRYWTNEKAKELWHTYMKQIHDELYGGLRIGTDYDFDYMIHFGFEE
jgi:hypothetical protein